MITQALKFTLKSHSACIRKAHSNSTYFTFNFPHKIMLYGILGAIIGENGYNYNQLHKINDLPECYLNLKHLKLAVIPTIKYGAITKSLHVFNNSVGYASKDGNLIIKEQWLENPKWDIYVLDDNSDIFIKIKEYILNSKCEYIPFIGKNDHFAIIENAEIVDLSNISSEDNINKIDSICIGDKITVNNGIEDYIFAYDPDNTNNEKAKFISNEILPLVLDKDIGYSNYREFIYTNRNVIIKDYADMYSLNDKIISFF